jgi:hypothetical protein
MVFTSNDKLHANTVPLFLRSDQMFVHGADLKADIHRLDEHFSAQPAEVLERGVMYFEPPFDGDYLTTKLWKRFLPGWRAREGKPGDVKMSPERSARLVEEMRQNMEAPTGPPVEIDEADFVAVQRVYPVKMGKWRIIPQDVAERSWKHELEQRQRGGDPTA